MSVRILAAKTYLIDKKITKAIHVLTDLCYIIPPDMLNINGNNANLRIYETSNENLGGIRFCN